MAGLNVDSRSPICWRQPFSDCRMTRFKWWQTAALQTTAHDHQEGQALWLCQTIEKTSLMTTNLSLPIWIEVANRYVHRYTSQGTYVLHSTQGWYKFWFCWRRIFSLKHYPLQRHLRHCLQNKTPSYSPHLQIHLKPDPKETGAEAASCSTECQATRSWGILLDSSKCSGEGSRDAEIQNMQEKLLGGWLIRKHPPLPKAVTTPV